MAKENKIPLKDRPWYPYAVALCIAVILYVVLVHIGGIWKGFTTFLGFFSTVFLGCVFAYLVNPLARFFRNRVFKNLKKDKTKNLWSNVLAFATVLIFLSFVLGMVIPQLVESVMMFANNLDGYVASVMSVLAQFGITELPPAIQEFLDSSESMLSALASLITSNMSRVISTAGNVGKGAMNWIIALLLSMYLLAEKDHLKGGSLRLMREFLPGRKYDNAISFLKRCDGILSQYIIYNLLDALIVGVVNAILMAIFGMPYIGLVSIVVALCNLVPTFGPIIGAIIGGFILILVKPWYALAFLIFTLVLQTVDGYFLKPRLFGGSLGVSGLWILVGIIVGGKMFGMIGILLAIPVVAIIDDVYHGYFLPWLMEKGPRARVEAKEEAAQKEANLVSAVIAFGGSVDDDGTLIEDTAGEEGEEAGAED